MQGLIRFIFAFMVAFAHLTKGEYILSHLGRFAVFGFYIISGYLITLTLNDVYRYNFQRFALNRVLRIFPSYYIVAIVSAFVIYYFPATAAYDSAWAVQTRAIDYIGNIFLFPFDFYHVSFRVVPHSWFLSVELICCVLLWAFVARNKKAAFFCFFLAVLYHLVSFMIGISHSDRYFPFYGALLPFSMGTLMYFYREEFAKVPVHVVKATFALVTAGLIINLVICGFYKGHLSPFYELSFYINLVLLPFFIIGTFLDPFKNKYLKIGAFLGGLSYPLFLCHRAVGFVVGDLFFNGKLFGVDVFAASIIPILIFSWLTFWFTEKYVEPLRHKIRQKA